MFRDRVAMGRSDKQSAQYEEIEGALRISTRVGGFGLIV
jgi:hypothetical protein